MKIATILIKKANALVKNVFRRFRTPGILRVAKYILLKKGSMPAMKLQKLCYYAQAWSLAWDGKPLFDEDFQAWPLGPVNPELYARHRKRFIVSPDNFLKYVRCRFTKEQKATLDAVLDYYGSKGMLRLSDMTHSDRPWQEARRGLPVGMYSENIITKESMRQYYSRIS